MSNHKFNDYWAVTMFSFTNELLAAERTALQLIEQLLASGNTRNIEIDGPMHFRNFPNPSHSEIEALENLLAKYDAKISLIGGAVDRAKSATRMVTSEEALTSVKTQLALAARLKAFGLRLMIGSLTLAELQELAPIAEKLNVKILFELHGVMAANSQVARECLQLIREVNSTHVRMMFDSSLFMTEFPRVLTSALEKAGVENIYEIKTLWLESKPIALAPRFGAFLPTLNSRMGHAMPEDYEEYFPYIESVHLKYWDQECDELPLLRYLASKNYQGYLTSEWGGHEWQTVHTASALEYTKQHKVQIEKQLASLN